MKSESKQGGTEDEAVSQTGSGHMKKTPYTGARTTRSVVTCGPQGRDTPEYGELGTGAHRCRCRMTFLTLLCSLVSCRLLFPLLLQTVQQTG